MDDDELKKAMTLAGETAPDKAEAATQHAKQMYDALSSKMGLGPDVFALFSTTNRLKFAAPQKAIDDFCDSSGTARSSCTGSRRTPTSESSAAGSSPTLTSR
ncbi:MAG TPA: hypothetical protein VHN14_23475 [Kofleriaceae bacterium]|nr:hypothetical protein [Kofleriaceae bacterium]